MAEDEFSDEEGMDLLAPNHRRRSSKGEKRKLITATGEDIVIGTKPEKEPLHFDKTLFDEGKLFFFLFVLSMKPKVTLVRSRSI